MRRYARSGGLPGGTMEWIDKGCGGRGFGHREQWLDLFRKF